MTFPLNSMSSVIKPRLIKHQNCKFESESEHIQLTTRKRCCSLQYINKDRVQTISAAVSKLEFYILQNSVSAFTPKGHMLWRNNVNLLCNQMFYFYFNSTTNNTFVNKCYSDTSLLVSCFLTNNHFCSLHSSPSKQHTVNKSYWNTVYFSYKSYFYFRFHKTHIYCWQYFRWRQDAALRLTLKLKG